MWKIVSSSAQVLGRLKCNSPSFSLLRLLGYIFSGSKSGWVDLSFWEMQFSHIPNHLTRCELFPFPLIKTHTTKQMHQRWIKFKCILQLPGFTFNRSVQTLQTTWCSWAGQVTATCYPAQRPARMKQSAYLTLLNIETIQIFLLVNQKERISKFSLFIALGVILSLQNRSVLPMR